MVWPRIFVSHSHKDDDFGRRLVQDLRLAAGGDEDSVWYDSAGGLRGGEEWWRKILAELSTRPIFLVILSPDAMDSPWVNDEIDIAWRLKNSPERKLILPILHRHCDIRQDVASIHYVSFVASHLYGEAFHELVGSIRGYSPSRENNQTTKAPAATPIDLLDQLHRAYQHDLAALDHYWHQVFYGPDLHPVEFEKYRRLAFNQPPAWQHLWYEGQITARVVELGSDTLARIHALHERLSLFDFYRGRLREQFQTEEAERLWQEYTEWKRATLTTSIEVRTRAQSEARQISKRLSDFCLPNTELWNACAALVNLIREAGNPVPPFAPKSEPSLLMVDENTQGRERVRLAAGQVDDDRSRPAIVPINGPPSTSGEDGVEYFDAESAQHQQLLLNAGKEAAFNIWGVLFGPKSAESLHILDRRRTFSYSGPLMPGKQYQVTAGPGRTVIAGDTAVGSDPKSTLLAPSDPPLGAMLYRDIPRVLARYTVTYQDANGRKYATVSDFTANHEWRHSFLADIGKDLSELDDLAREQLFPKP